MTQKKDIDQRFTLNRFRHMAGEGWYIDVREGRKGPFFSREDAEKYLEKHKRRLGWNREDMEEKLAVEAVEPFASRAKLDAQTETSFLSGHSAPGQSLIQTEYQNPIPSQQPSSKRPTVSVHDYKLSYSSLDGYSPALSGSDHHRKQDHRLGGHGYRLRWW